jgi:S-disulfanyl-L-cysteine oxidoreductase SoxD
MSTCRRSRIVAIVALIAIADVGPAAGQLPSYGLGRAPTTDEIKAWDLTIPSGGHGLPAGTGTAALGRAIYAERCAACHGVEGKEPKYDRLVGGRDSLSTDRPVLTVGSFWPSASTLWSYIRRSQPVDEPGSLTPDQAYAITAYLLHLNGLVDEHQVLDERSLPLVNMPNRDGFVNDPRPDVGQRPKSKKR